MADRDDNESTKQTRGSQKWQFMRRLYLTSGLSATACRCGLMIIDRLGDNEDVWPSLADFAEHLEVDRSSVSRAMKELEREALIQISRGGGSGRTSRYRPIFVPTKMPTRRTKKVAQSTTKNVAQAATILTAAEVKNVAEDANERCAQSNQNVAPSAKETLCSAQRESSSLNQVTESNHEHQRNGVSEETDLRKTNAREKMVVDVINASLQETYGSDRIFRAYDADMVPIVKEWLKLLPNSNELELIIRSTIETHKGNGNGSPRTIEWFNTAVRREINEMWDLNRLKKVDASWIEQRRYDVDLILDAYIFALRNNFDGEADPIPKATNADRKTIMKWLDRGGHVNADWCAEIIQDEMKVKAERNGNDSPPNSIAYFGPMIGGDNVD